jgi:hypothetical protein
VIAMAATCDYCNALAAPTMSANNRQICDECIEQRLIARGLDLQVLAACAEALAEEIMRRARVNGERKRKRYAAGCRRVYTNGHPS